MLLKLSAGDGFSRHVARRLCIFTMHMSRIRICLTPLIENIGPFWANVGWKDAARLRELTVDVFGWTRVWDMNCVNS